METETKGTLIIRGIPDEDVAQRVGTFMCANAKNATPEAVAARLKNLPLVLSSSISASTGTRVAKTLVAMGADAAFIPDPPPPPAFELENNPPPTGLQAPATPEPAPISLTAQPDHESAVGVVRRTPPVRPSLASRQPEVDLCEIALAQKLLIYGVVAGFVPALSPVLYFVTAPFQLYAVYRISAALKSEIGSRVLYMLCMLVPLLGLIMLLVLNAKATKLLRASDVSVGLFGTSSDDINVLGGGERGGSNLGPAYVAILALVAIVGVWTGILPKAMSMPSTEESAESLIEREVAQANKQFPKDIDAETRIDNLTAGPDKLVTFNYTLLKHPSTEVDSNALQQAVTEKIKHETCVSKEMQPLIKKGVSVAYAFNGNDGNRITTITIAPADCGN